MSSLLAPAPTPIRHKQRVRDSYTELAATFEAWQPSNDFRTTFHHTVIAEIRRRTAGPSPLNILEVGCGHGTWAAEIFEHVSGTDLNYLGIDFTECRIHEARRRMAVHQGARFEIADCESFTPPHPFDLILAVEVISHVPFDRYHAWLTRWHDWLAPGGTVIIIDKERYSRHNLRLKWDSLKKRFLPRALRSRSYYFADGFEDYVRTLDYPSFGRLTRTARAAGLSPRPLFRLNLFRALTADRPASR